jgi:hypothetical protein
MRDTMKPVRHAVNAALGGNITYAANPVPVRDEKIYTGESPKIYILLSTQQETDTDRTDCTWTTRSSIDLEFITRSGSEVSKDVLDDVSNDALELLIGLPTSGLIPNPSGFQITDVVRESAITRNITLTGTESILQKTVRIIFTILQQN